MWRKEKRGARGLCQTVCFNSHQPHLKVRRELAKKSQVTRMLFKAVKVGPHMPWLRRQLWYDYIFIACLSHHKL